MSSVASTETLSSLHGPATTGTGIPYDIVETILKEAVGQELFDGFELVSSRLPLSISAIDRRLFVEALWGNVSKYAAVSSMFHSITVKTLILAFTIEFSDGIPYPENVYNKFRSLVYFANALRMGAFMAPPASWRSTLLEAYAYYFMMQQLLFYPEMSHTVVICRSTADALLQISRLSVGRVELMRPLLAAGYKVISYDN